MTQVTSVRGRLGNPLDAFSSYSTHFALTACRTTEQARQFMEAPPAEIMDALLSADQLGANLTFQGHPSDMYLVLDTRRFTQFSVDRCRYELLLNGLQTGQGHPNFASQVDLTILDSVGISFINFLQWLMDEKMQTNFDGLVFILNVIFVGHVDPHDPAPDKTPVIHAASIPLMLIKLDLNLDQAKGSYDLSFLPNTNFDQRHGTRWLSVGTTTTFTSIDNKLGTLIDSIQQTLNESAKAAYDTLGQLFIQAGKKPKATTGSGYGRLVTYQLTLPEEWRDFTYTGKGISSATERDYAAQKSSDTSATPAKSSFISVPPNALVTDVIELILKGTQETLKYANGEKLKDNKAVSFYKFLVSISSDEVSFCVHVDVIPFDVPNVQPGDTPAADTADLFYQKVQEPSGLEVSVPRNYFELDYLFTGKNLDIIHLDLKMQDLNFLLSSNVAVSEGDIFNVQGYGQGDPKDAKGQPIPKPALYSTRQYDPIFIPDTTKEQLTNFSTYVAARSQDTNYKLKADVQSYTRNLAAFYAQSATMVNFVIKGNPLIMEKFNIGTPLEHPSTPSSAPTSHKAYRDYLTTSILKNPKAKLNAGKGTFSVPSTLGSDSYITSPVFFKLNVKGPNVDFISGEQRDGGDFATDILTNIYYIVFKVVNVIERGVFTQEIEGYSHNVFGSGKVTHEKSTPRRSV